MGIRVATSTIYTVHIPPGTKVGENFFLCLQDYVFSLPCPPGKIPGDAILTTLICKHMNSALAILNGKKYKSHEMLSNSNVRAKQKVFQARVPAGVSCGCPFPVLVQGKVIMMTCPTGSIPGDTVSFSVYI